MCGSLFPTVPHGRQSLKRRHRSRGNSKHGGWELGEVAGPQHARRHVVPRWLDSKEDTGSRDCLRVHVVAGRCVWAVNAHDVDQLAIERDVVILSSVGPDRSEGDGDTSAAHCSVLDLYAQELAVAVRDAVESFVLRQRHEHGPALRGQVRHRVDEAQIAFVLRVVVTHPEPIVRRCSDNRVSFQRDADDHRNCSEHRPLGL